MMASKRQPSIDASAIFLCLLAAGCGSLKAALLTVSAGAACLLLSLLALGALRPLTGGWRSAAALILSAALTTAVRLGLYALSPSWSEAMGPSELATATLLFSGPAACSLMNRPAALTPGRIFGSAAALLGIGAARELLSAGSLMEVRLLPDNALLSSSFGFGAAGIVLTGVLMALFRLRGQGRVFGVRPREGGVFALCAAARCVVVGGMYTLFTRVLPLPEAWRLWAAALTAAVLSLLGQALFAPKQNASPMRDVARWASGDATLGTLAILTVIVVDARLLQAAPLAAFGLFTAGAAILFALCALVTAAVPRLDTSGNIHLPVSFRPLPVLVTMAGLAMLALSVLP